MLKKLFISLFAIALTLNSHALADGNGIAVVNVDKVKMETKAGKSIAEQLNNLQNKLKDKVAKLQKDFDSQKQDIDKQKTVLSKDAFEKKENEFNDKVNNARKDIQTESTDIEQMQQTALEEFNQIALSVIADIAKEGKYLQIIPAEIVIYSDPKVDITSQVIAAIDKKADTIALKPANAPAADTKAKK